LNGSEAVPMEKEMYKTESFEEISEVSLLLSE